MREHQGLASVTQVALARRAPREPMPASSATGPVCPSGPPVLFSAALARIARMQKGTTSLRRSASPRRALLAGVMALVALATSGTARAEARSISVVGVACPGAEAVVAALAEVLVHTEVRQVDGPADIVIEATDADVRITAFGSTKRFAGSCDERVRLLSAYVALGLEPPMPMAPVEPPAERPVAPPAVSYTHLTLPTSDLV